LDERVDGVEVEEIGGLVHDQEMGRDEAGEELEYVGQGSPGLSSSPKSPSASFYFLLPLPRSSPFPPSSSPSPSTYVKAAKITQDL
jgi:hypothetical protein